MGNMLSPRSNEHIRHWGLWEGDKAAEVLPFLSDAAERKSGH